MDDGGYPKKQNPWAVALAVAIIGVLCLYLVLMPIF